MEMILEWAGSEASSKGRLPECIHDLRSYNKKSIPGPESFVVIFVVLNAENDSTSASLPCHSPT